ncbi:MAG: DinB family protein [Terracidiphilus sp.]
MDDPHPGLDIPQILRDTPTLLRLLVKGFNEETLQWTPNPERWSASMVIAHLAESEVACFRTRLIRTALEELPLLEAYDQWAFLRTQAAFPVESALHRFEMERATTLRFLENQSTEVFERRCTHRELGVLTFANLLHEFAFHDMGHIRQILELCRSHAYYPKMGGWKSYYTVSP